MQSNKQTIQNNSDIMHIGKSVGGSSRRTNSYDKKNKMDTILTYQMPNYSRKVNNTLQINYEPEEIGPWVGNYEKSKLAKKIN